MTKNKKRTEELDWLKAVCILLMIAFHLVYFEHLYPQAKNVVYVFHMPIFLIISGYLMNVGKNMRSFFKSMAALLLPYIIMETAYCIGASILPINEHIDNLTIPVLVSKIFLHPIGPYWFLHTLILCSCIWYAVSRIKLFSSATKILFFIMLLWCAGEMKILSLSVAIYFVAGAALREAGIGFLDFFKPSVIAPLLAAGFIIIIPNLDKSSCTGVVFIYLMISIMLLVFKYISKTIRSIFLFIGRNTLPILLFSPLFTLAAKYYQPIFCSIDATGILFMLVSVFLGAFGSILIQRGLAWLKIWQLITLSQH